MLDNSNTTTSRISSAAQDYVSRGWHVIAIHGVKDDGTCRCVAGKKCRSAGKHPVSAGWQSSTKPDAATVDHMWTNRKHDNIGLLTGTPGGFFVVDIDVKSGGMESMGALVAQHGNLPKTLAVKTGSGGWHYYFAMPNFEVTNRNKTWPQGIDIRGTGGQVVAPPSVSSTGTYVLKFDQEIAPAPDWVLDLLRVPDAAKPLVEQAKAAFEQSDQIRAAVAALPKPVVMLLDQTKREAAIEHAAYDGELARLTALPATGWNIGWDSTTFEVACNLIELANSERAGLTMDEALIAFTDHCPPIEDGYEPMLKWDSARVKVGDKARVLVAAERPKDFMDDETGMRIDPRLRLVAQVDAARAEITAAGGLLEDGDFFNKNQLLAAKLAKAVVAVGPIRMGQDGFWWTYDAKGCWVESKDAVKNRVVALLGDKFRVGHAANAEMIVASTIEKLMMDHPDAQYMNFTNGMLCWRTGELKPHGPEFESITSFPVAYDSEATCPRFDAFLASIMHPDYIRLAWEMLGYLMYSGNPLQKAFLFHGTGANGKGTLIRVIQEILGRENLSSQSLDALSGTRFASANLFGKIANIAGDIDGTFQQSTAMFKMLTGEDRISGEHKFGRSFMFDSWAVPVFSANKIPGSADVSVGYLRRWVVLEFNKSFEGKAILGLSDELIREKVGIAAKAVAHLAPVLDRSKFDISGEATKGVEKFAMAIDQVRQWVDDATMPAPNYRTARSPLYQRYRSWADANGIKSLQAEQFYVRLAGMGFVAKTIRGTRMIEGLVPVEESIGDRVQSDIDTFLS